MVRHTQADAVDIVQLFVASCTANNLAVHVLQFFRILTPFVTGMGSCEYLDPAEKMLLEVGENYTLRGFIITVFNKYY